jgi:CHAT domain-containing protein/tetratricopeptide (TPR) repeat protein
MLQTSTSGTASRESAQKKIDSLPVTSARQQPDSARAAITRLLALAVSQTTDSLRAKNLTAARDIARAYATAWQDTFLTRQVAVFERWSSGQRATHVAADSIRRAGNEALGRTGVPSAMRLWRLSLRLAVTLGDSAGQAAALGNVGAGFYRAGTLDSAVASLLRSRDLAIAIGDHRTEGNAVGMLANISQDRGDFASADELYTRAAGIRARSGDTRGLAADQNNLGVIAQSLGDLEGARRAFEAASAINRRAGRPSAMAVNLTNLANIASLTADFPRASALYRDALAVYKDGGFRADAASVWHKLGLLELRRGDYEQARIALSEALSLADSTGAVPDAIAIRADLAAVYGAMGKLQPALTVLRRAERDAVGSHAGPTLLAGLALAGADLAMRLNDFSEAERLHARASTFYRGAGDDVGQSAAQQGQGLLLLLRDDNAGAARLFARAARTQAAAGDKRSAALTRLLLGYALAQKGDTADGRRALVGAARELSAVGDAIGEAAALSALGDLVSRSGAALAAESFYRRGLDRLAGLQAPEVRWQLNAGLGEALRSRGALGDAAREMRSAISDIERMAASLPLEDRRSAFLADKWDVFAQLALVERARGRDGDAFVVSERMRARQMLDLLARGRIAPVAGRRDTTSAREQDLRQQISDLTRSLERSGNGNRPLRGPSLDARVKNPAREALDAAQKAYAALLVEMRESNPSYARLVSGETATWREVASRLASDEVLLEYLTTDSATIVFVVTRDTIEAIELDVSRRALTRLIDFTREAMSRPDRSLPAALWRSPLRRLAQLLIAPVQVAGHLDGKRALIIVPHGQLHFLPFQALLIDSAPDRFLVERFRVTYAPSASLWLRLSDRRRNATADDVLALAPRPDALPASRGEVDAIGDIFGDRASVLVGAAASERAFRTLAPTKSIVHIATYGVLNKHNPLFSFVELAPDGENDGRLEVHEVFALTLNARLLVLSACQTALGSGAIADVPSGDDWVGLVQGFLAAGAANVLATLWPVEDRATAGLMSSFYRELYAGRSESAALAEAQRAALRDSRTAHPFYWAGFVLSGGR